MAKTSSKAPIIIEDESDSNDEYGGPYWAGPGMYWGIYISNEEDYWRHYNQRYSKRPPNEDGEKREAGDDR